jgi:hypothetical protein
MQTKDRSVQVKGSRSEFAMAMRWESRMVKHSEIRTDCHLGRLMANGWEQETMKGHRWGQPTASMTGNETV